VQGGGAGQHLLEIVGLLASETDVEAAARILLERLLGVPPRPVDAMPHAAGLARGRRYCTLPA
jgi:hypothetical protein